MKGRLSFFGLLQCCLFFHVTGFRSRLGAKRGGAPLELVETVCPDPTLPRGDSLFPPINQDLPPLIMHVKADVAYSTIVEFITKETLLPLSLVIELIEFGSVYLQKAGQNKLRRLVTKNAGTVAKGSYARVHVNPRRYPDVHKVSSWEERIRVIGKYIVLDKPSGAMPHIPTVDNNVENVMSSVSKALRNLPSSLLYPVGRLDACTSGVCLFATDQDSARRANDAIQSRTVRKFYSVLCYEPSSCTTTFPKGVVQHLFRKKALSHPNAKPTLLRSITPPLEENESDLWQVAQLSILDSSRPFLLKLDESETMVREVSVELGTGLTHQIRLQMAALGYPVVNDSRYVPVKGLLDAGPNTPWGDGSTMVGREPRIKTGLHCAQLIYPGTVFAQHEDEVLTASDPWWQGKE